MKTDHQNFPLPSSQARPDSIGCAGVILLLTFAVALFLGGTDRPAQEVGPLPADNIAALAGLAAPGGEPAQPTTPPLPTPTLRTVPPTFTPAPSHTPPPTASATPNPPTATATATATATSSPSQTPTAAPSATPGGTPSAAESATPEPLPTPQDASGQTVRLPILMYHYISVPPAEADAYRLDLSVEPDDFRWQMEYLAANGYTTLDFYDLSLAVAGKKTLPPRPVIVSIDDGYRDAYEQAFPILRALGQTATIFVVTGFVDQGLPQYLTWNMIEEMAAAGIRFEPHTRNHLDLRDRDEALLRWEIGGAQADLAAHLGYRPRYFAYPSGRYDDKVLQLLPALDFWGAVTTAGGWWHGLDDRYEWARLRMRHDTTLSEFVWLLTAGQ